MSQVNIYGVRKGGVRKRRVVYTDAQFYSVWYDGELLGDFPTFEEAHSRAMELVLLNGNSVRVYDFTKEYPEGV